MQQPSWDLFLNQIVIDTVQSESKGKLYRDLGIDWRDWPTCEAKDLMRDYEAIAAHNPDRARFRLAPKIERLGGFQLPQEFTVLAGQYQEMVTIGNVVQYAEALLKSPLDYKRLQNEFNSRSVEDISDVVMQQVIEDVLKAQEEKAKEGKAVITIPGWEALSNLIGGFNPGRITILAAGTGVGKTNLALNLALSAIKKFKVYYFNMEMTIEDIVGRCVRRGVGITSTQWNKADFKDKNVGDWWIKVNKEHEFKVTKGKALSLNQIVGRIYTEASAGDLGLVFVDYDQKITSSYTNEEWQNLRRITEDLEECAKAANTHIILLAQGNEDGLPKSSKRMMQAASTVLSFYEDNGEFLIRATKNRHGRYGVQIKTEYNPEISFIREIGELSPKEQMSRRVMA